MNWDWKMDVLRVGEDNPVVLSLLFPLGSNTNIRNITYNIEKKGLQERKEERKERKAFSIAKGLGHGKFSKNLLVNANSLPILSSELSWPVGILSVEPRRTYLLSASHSAGTISLIYSNWEQQQGSSLPGNSTSGTYRPGVLQTLYPVWRPN
jgi:hypothetical protein